MIGQQLAVLLGDTLNRALDTYVERVYPLLERLVVLAVILRALRVPLCELVAGYLRVAERVDGVGPKMRIWITRLPGERKVVHVLVGSYGLLCEQHDLRARLLVRLSQLQRGLFEVQTIDKYKVRSSKRARYRGGRLKGVGVRTLGHHADDGCPLAGNVVDDVRDGRDGSYQPQLLLRRL